MAHTSGSARSPEEAALRDLAELLYPDGEPEPVSNALLNIARTYVLLPDWKQREILDRCRYEGI